MRLVINLDSINPPEAVFTMTIVGDPSNEAAGTYSTTLGEPITLDLPTTNVSSEQGE